MAIEVAGFEMVHSPLENGAHEEKENGNLNKGVKGNQSIKFGSHENETVKGEGDKVQEAETPKNVSDEWPMPKQIHSFYFVKYRTYDDPAIKAKFDQADREIQEKNKARLKLMDELRAKRANRSELISQLKPLRGEDRKFREILNEIKPLQQAIRSQDSANRGGGICSSEEELNAVIQSLNYRIQHESIPLSEEKQILKEIKQLEGTREKVIANAVRRTQLQDSLVQKEAAIQDQVKLIGNDLADVRKEQKAVVAKIKPINDQLQVLDDEIKSLESQLNSLTQKKDKAFEAIKELRAHQANGNASFFDSRKVITVAKNLATTKDVKALEELCHVEFEKFMSQWSRSKSFRDDYKKRVLQSLDSRQLSKDGRMRNPDEKPSQEAEVTTSVKLETVAKASAKHAKEDSKPSAKPHAVTSQKAQKEAPKKATDVEKVDVPENEKAGSEELKKDLPAKIEISAEKLKEMRREEELAKAKQAMERKKKLAEKAAAKAAIRAQKEAEKKLKEREKKAAKKAAASAPPTDAEPVEEIANAPEPEKNEEELQPSAPVIEKVKKESKIRNRNRARGPDSVSKILKNRKKSGNYWVWVAVAAAALIILILAVLGYRYLN